MSDEPLIHDPGNKTEIDTLYAFMSIDWEDKNGLVAAVLPGVGWTPLVFGKLELAMKMTPFAQEVARKTGKAVGLFRFQRDAQLWQSE